MNFPKIIRSRQQLICYINEYEDGAHTLFVSSDTYPELLSLKNSELIGLSPKGWLSSKSRKMRYLWFPPNALNQDTLEWINDWKEKWEKYVLIGLNENLKVFFSNELDFCLALSYNYDSQAGKRTHYGEAMYQYKFHESREHSVTLKSALLEAILDLPIFDDKHVITSIPSDPDSFTAPRKLALNIAHHLGNPYMKSELHCDKQALKNLDVSQKIPEWQKLYANEKCIKLSECVENKNVVIIDDLYQSGSTMWSYAQYLKKKGASSVQGLVCVKSMRDSDNQ